MFQFPVTKLRLANYFLLALILAAALFTARSLISYLAFDGETVPAAVSETSDKTTPAKSSSIMQYASIVEKNPFGPPMKFQRITTPGQPYAEVEIKEASLTGLTLIGTVVGPDDMSYAIFEGGGGASGEKQKVVAQGEPVYNYGTLSGVYTDSVLIMQGGVNHTLEMVESVSTQKKNQKGRKNKSGKSFVKKVGKRKYELDKRQVEQSIENPEKILTDARLLPNFINGRQEGFRISEVKPKGLYDNLGLKNGDILLRVNNLEISNPEVAIQAMSTLRGTNNVNLDIIRSSKKMSLNYQIK